MTARGEPAVAAGPQLDLSVGTGAQRDDQQSRLFDALIRYLGPAVTRAFADDDVLMVGRESAGVPAAIAAVAALQLRIPMREGLRSLNVATAASLVLGEALRQTGGFGNLQ